MECNKEEAIRAKEIAEKRMQSKDFAGAQKFVLKAQKLYPGLENLSQMLIVCEVHVSAELKVGTEMDWYGILQVPHTADEPFIKKQYRKLALVLHPDKNNFPGAEAAFKLIGEANRVLSDQAKRTMYDIRRRNNQTTMTKQQPAQMNKSYYPNGQAGFEKNIANQSTSQHPGMSQSHQQKMNNSLTFWTTCPFCRTMYQHVRTFLNKVIRCQTCLHPFVAYELNVQGGSARSNSGYVRNPSAVSHCKDVPNQAMHKTGQESTVGNSSSSVQYHENTSRGAGMSESSSKTRTSADGHMFDRKASEEGDLASGRVMSEEKHMEMNKGAQTGKSPGNVGRKRGRYAAAETRGVELEEEIGSSPIKKTKEESSKDSENLEVNFTIPSNTDMQANDPIKYPDPEFYDFDKDRVQKNFKVDQIWAVYDEGDGMPRWYARIKKILSNGSMRFLWLEAQPSDQNALNWLEEKLPVACGNFRQGLLQDAEDFLMFSHLASWEKGNAKCTYKIYPKKGQVWALFKDWSVQWSSSPDAHRKYKFEFVEILYDYVEGTGVEVAYLVMLEGFTSLFQRVENTEKNCCHIPPNELLRFSHRVPCYRMTGEERQGVPPGSFELDPASVFTEGFSCAKGVDSCVGIEPKSASYKPGIENKTPSVGSEMLNTAKGRAGASEKNSLNKENFVTGRETPATRTDVPNTPKKRTSAKEKEVHNKENFVYRRCSPQKKIGVHEKKPSDDMSVKEPDRSIPTEWTDGKEKNSAADEILPNGAIEDNFPSEPVFHNFESDKLNCFKQGQIWAVYSEEDGGLPKYYALIRKIELQEFKVHANWLEACPQSFKEIWWSKKELPVACGKFKAQTGEIQTFVTAHLSHRVRHTPTEGGYLILPKKGEVWVIYKNWNAEWTFRDLECCEYEVVEVLDDARWDLEVMILEVVDGYRSIYKGGVKMNIPREELLRFSHLVPSFRLTKERGGMLSGYLELDPLALPDSLLREQLK